MRGRKVTRLICFGLASISFSINLVQAQQLERLHDTRRLIVELLDKFENGRSPCFDSSCQTRKQEALSETHKLYSSNLLIRKDPRLDQAFYSGHRLVKYRFVDPNPSPKSLSDYYDWWERRYSHEISLDSSWLGFFSSVIGLFDAVKIFRSLQSKTPQYWERLASSMNNGLFEAAQLRVEGVELFSQSRAAYLQGNFEESERLKKMSEDRNERLKLIEQQNLKKPITFELKEVLPMLDAPEACSFVIHLGEWQQALHARSIDEEGFSDAINYFSDQTLRLHRITDEFNELEYGVVGVKNFDTSVNPAVAIENELKIQGRLSLAEGAAKFLLEAASYVFLARGLGSTLGPNQVLPRLATGYLQYHLFQKDMNLSQVLIPESNISAQLASQLPSAEQKMMKRQESLKRGVEQLRARLDLIESQIESMEEQQ